MGDPKIPQQEEDEGAAIEAAAAKVENLHREKKMIESDVDEARKKIGDSSFDQNVARKNLEDAMNRASWIEDDILKAENELQKLGE